MNTLRIATRKSRLALWQAEHVADLLRARLRKLDIERVPLTTRGDVEVDKSLLEIGGKGLFLKELERALLDGQADIAVHSLKDVPADMTPGLEIPVFLPREVPDDAWLCPQGHTPGTLPPGSRVGTSSLRRQAQALRSNPALEVHPLRGNVNTRLRKLDQGEFDAIVLARAGLKRLGLEARMSAALSAPEWLPAPGQGIICIQCRTGDQAVRETIGGLNCVMTETIARAERALVATLGGDCRMPLAALAVCENQVVRLEARLFHPDGSGAIASHQSGPPDQASDIGKAAAREILSQGGQQIINSLT